VTDAGEGIHPDFLAHIFQRFRQADTSTSRRHGGLGLGLTIARELIELHHGSIRAESPGVGKGATFTIELPLSQRRADDARESQAAGMDEVDWHFVPAGQLRGLRALVVEDDAASREVLQYLLQQCQAEVTAVDNAAAALAAFRSRLGQASFDLVLSDIALPETNGHELIRQIRAIEQRAGVVRPTTALALTARALDEDRAEALSAGFNAHLTKPVRAALLVRTLTDLLRRV
jgi:CheY-like chemotaxis protein